MKHLRHIEQLIIVQSVLNMGCGLGTNTDYRPTDWVWNVDKEQDADLRILF